MSIASNLKKLYTELPPAVKLVAVSKFHPAEVIMEAYSCGQRAFGESRPQELVRKAQELPNDIEWHFIGHLQTNKIKEVVRYAALIQSVDSEHLLKEINKCAEAVGKTVECLLEVHIAEDESSKQGFTPEEALQVIENRGEYAAVKLRGVMGMASFTDDTELIHKEFRTLKTLADSVSLPEFDILSMGMSGDYRIAIDEGTTLVRIGTSIFGERKYDK